MKKAPGIFLLQAPTLTMKLGYSTTDDKDKSKALSIFTIPYVRKQVYPKNNNEFLYISLLRFHQTKLITMKRTILLIKGIMPWLALIIFMTPFIMIPIGDYKFSLGPIYTFGLELKDFFTMWIALFGVVGIIYNIWHNQKRLSQQEILINLQHKSERNSRFAKGVELLGNSQESARIGGVYSLILLAKEYPAEFKTIVFNTLCSHIRTRTNTDDYPNKYPDEPSIEIQTLINFLFYDLGQFFSSEIANLSKAYLSGANMIGIDLREADLSWTDLSAAELSRADLSEADLCHAKLFSTELVGTKLIGADLSEANLSDANLSKADLSLATLFGTVMTDVNLYEAVFDKDDFERFTISTPLFTKRDD